MEKASIERRKPDVIINDVLAIHKQLKRDYGKGFTKFGVEVVQFQHFFKDVLAQKSVESGDYLLIEEIFSLAPKHLRIESLQPFIKNAYIKFNERHKQLTEQLKVYPMGSNDDAPDCLEMAVKLAIASNAAKTDYKTVFKRALRFKQGSY